MCRWGCNTLDTTYMCRWCGTRYCRECLRGAFEGAMKEAATCRVCNQSKCQGRRVDYVLRSRTAADEMASEKSATRSRSSSPSKRSRSSKSKKGKKLGKKHGKKRKRR